MLLWYAEEGYNHPAFVRKAKNQLGNNARIPDRRSLNEWKEKLLTDGTLDNKKRRVNKPVRTTDNIDYIREIIDENPNISIRDIVKLTSISYSTVHRILTQDLNLYPYKAHVVQELKPGDPEARSSFARAMMEYRLSDPTFHEDLVFFDEALFRLQGVPNRQNYRTWAESDPAVTFEKPLHPPYLHVLMGIGCYGLVGPFFFEGTVNGQRYYEMLRDQAIPALTDWPNRENLVFVHDGAPPHIVRDVKALLNFEFPVGWIGRGSEMLVWPPRSPDLTPMDFFVWGYLKQRIYRGQAYPNFAALKARIIEEAESVPVHMFVGAMFDFWKRLLICERNGGLSVETRDMDDIREELGLDS